VIDVRTIFCYSILLHLSFTLVGIYQYLEPLQINKCCHFQNFAKYLGSSCASTAVEAMFVRIRYTDGSFLAHILKAALTVPRNIMRPQASSRMADTRV